MSGDHNANQKDKSYHAIRGAKIMEAIHKANSEEPQMKHIALLTKAHDLIRGGRTVTPHGMTTQDADKLAKDINDYLNFEQTHGPGCWSWGPQHYMCALHKIKELEKELSALND